MTKNESAITLHQNTNFLFWWYNQMQMIITNWLFSDNKYNVCLAEKTAGIPEQNLAPRGSFYMFFLKQKLHKYDAVFQRVLNFMHINATFVNENALSGRESGKPGSRVPRGYKCWISPEWLRANIHVQN